MNVKLDTTINLNDIILTADELSKINNNEFVKLNYVNGTTCIDTNPKYD